MKTGAELKTIRPDRRCLSDTLLIKMSATSRDVCFFAAMEATADTKRACAMQRRALDSCFAHDLRANVTRCRQRKQLHTFPDHALVQPLQQLIGLAQIC